MGYSNESLVSWANDSSSPGGDREHSHDYALNHRGADFREQDATLSYGTPAALSSLYSQQDVQIQSPISPGQLGLASHDRLAMNIPSSNLHHGESGFGVDSIVASSQHHEDSSNSGLSALHSSRNIQEIEDFSSNWYQHTFTSINWLPENWTPDFAMGDRDDIGATNHESYPGLRSRVDNTTAHNSFNNSTHQDPGRRPGIPSVALSQRTDGQNSSSPGSQSTQSAGQYYVDGEGARLPRVRKAPYRMADTVIPLSPGENQQLHRGYMFPNIDDSHDTPNISATEEIPLAMYNEIIQVFSLTCITSTHYTPFQSGAFPSQNALRRSIHLYFENFQPVFPFLHPATFNLSTSHWLLVVAVTAVGNHYIESEDTELLTGAMHEFTRRAIQYMVSPQSSR